MSIFTRKPDRIIGINYLHRWHVIPRNPFFNIFLHRFVGSDDDRALHDHPFASVSFLLQGELFEIYKDSKYPDAHGARRIKRFWPVFRRAKHTHRLVLGVEGDAWTLFITGPVLRTWGFHCPKGWVHHKQFTDLTGTRIGRGCD
jgi:hypothetical protein